ncbi:MAG: SDR family oxidoreductase [Gemmatimonadetes bacterium]|nr:enoyl-ACP reductase [Gemmatimonadota bacterium]NIQ58109.1 enoyl-ACP reductase [Gemmatimonadota bacterium]NIU78311.1 SDR family oxidoreductase [Gammaproteobacteria bacterium]NIX47265.1 SDR family oxidoreductase [Gemmatimonadota bacterium]NIY11642.1 SDR family oxidoreductase [Gemmatimonadota bacterium]
MAGLMDGKRVMVFGVANQRSIAWGISQAMHEQGARLGFNYLGEALERRVRPLAESVGSDLVVPCDVTDDEEVAETFGTIEQEWGGLDVLVHSVAYADKDDLGGRFSDTTRAGYLQAIEISAYSLVHLAREARPLMRDGGSIVTMTYYGAEKAVPNYNIMGVAKATLEASVRYLAADLGPEGIRVNAISAGPIKTLAASGVKDFRKLLRVAEERAPLRRNVTQEEVGQAALFLCSDMGSGITGEVLHVDSGYNILGH